MTADNYNSSYNEGIVEGEKRTFKKCLESVDKLLDKMSWYKKLLISAYKLMGKEEAKSKNTERLSLLETIRNEFKELREKKDE